MCNKCLSTSCGFKRRSYRRKNMQICSKKTVCVPLVSAMLIQTVKVYLVRRIKYLSITYITAHTHE